MLKLLSPTFKKDGFVYFYFISNLGFFFFKFPLSIITIDHKTHFNYYTVGMLHAWCVKMKIFTT